MPRLRQRPSGRYAVDPTGRSLTPTPRTDAPQNSGEPQKDHRQVFLTGPAPTEMTNEALGCLKIFRAIPLLV
jgi:hypothetical protein